MKVIITSIPLIICNLILLSCSDNVPYGPPGPGGWGGMMHYGFGYGGALMWIIFLIVVGLLIYVVLHAGNTKAHNETPLDILKKRYARGEITKEEYEKMRRDLEN